MKLTRLSGALLAAGFLFLSSNVLAAPTNPVGKVNGATVLIKNGFTDEVAKSVQGPAAKVAASDMILDLKEISDEDLVKIVKAFPSVKNFYVESKLLTDISPLKNLTVSNGIKIYAEHVKDMTPLLKFTGIKQLYITSKAMENLKWMTPLTNLTTAVITGSDKIKSIEGIPAAPKLSNVSLKVMDIADLTPVSALPLTKLDLTGSQVKDLSPLAANTKLNELSLYGVTVADFTPLSKVPALKRLTVYASKGANYDSLGTLAQVEKIDTGMTAMTSLDWVKTAAKLKYLGVFAEAVKDYSPIKGSSVEALKIWSMRAPVDFAQLKDATNLKQLIVHGCDQKNAFFNTDAIGSLTELNSLEVKLWKHCDYVIDASFGKGLKKLNELAIDGINNLVNTEDLKNLSSVKKVMLKDINPGKTVDLGFLAGMTDLTNMEITGVKVSNFDAIAACSKLQTLDISKTEGITSLGALKGIPGLRVLSVKKGAFSDDELKGFASPSLKINQK